MSHRRGTWKKRVDLVPGQPSAGEQRIRDDQNLVAMLADEFACQATKAFLLAFQGLIDAGRAPGFDILGEKRASQFDIVAVAAQLRVEDEPFCFRAGVKSDGDFLGELTARAIASAPAVERIAHRCVTEFNLRPLDGHAAAGEAEGQSDHGVTGFMDRGGAQRRVRLVEHVRGLRAA
jgi:hypothetical protein